MVYQPIRIKGLRHPFALKQSAKPDVGAKPNGGQAPSRSTSRRILNPAHFSRRWDVSFPQRKIWRTRFRKSYPALETHRLLFHPFARATRPISWGKLTKPRMLLFGTMSGLVKPDTANSLRASVRPILCPTACEFVSQATSLDTGVNWEG